MVLIATTNDEEYLRALSGENRRFLPVTVGRVDFKALIRDRDQLWAEASAEEPLEGALSLPEELWQHASEARASRTQVDPWADVLEDIAERAAAAQGSFINIADADDEPFHTLDEGGTPIAIYGTGSDRDGNLEERVASDYVIGTGLNIPVDRRTPDMAKRVGLVMRSLGWAAPKVSRINGKPVRAYMRRVAQPWD